MVDLLIKRTINGRSKPKSLEDETLVLLQIAIEYDDPEFKLDEDML